MALKPDGAKRGVTIDGKIVKVSGFHNKNKQKTQT